MINVEIKINNEAEVLAQIDRLAHGISNLSPLMGILSGTMYSAVMQNFDAGGRPAWIGLKYRVGKPLTDTGHLRGSISEFSDNNSAVVGTNSIYAAIHNYGGVIKPKTAKALAIPKIYMVKISYLYLLINKLAFLSALRYHLTAFNKE